MKFKETFKDGDEVTVTVQGKYSTARSNASWIMLDCNGEEVELLRTDVVGMELTPVSLPTSPGMVVVMGVGGHEVFAHLRRDGFWVDDNGDEYLPSTLVALGWTLLPTPDATKKG